MGSFEAPFFVLVFFTIFKNVIHRLIKNRTGLKLSQNKRTFVRYNLYELFFITNYILFFSDKFRVEIERDKN